MINEDVYKSIREELSAKNVTLVAVSKTKPVDDIQALYDLGQRDFGENYVQELVEKQEKLPKDIRWHFIGHLQSNKVKYIAPFVHLIHSIDNEKLLKEVNKHAAKQNRIIDCLLQVFIAEEETKWGMDDSETEQLIQMQENNFSSVHIKGLMGMASNTEDKNKIKAEFRHMQSLFSRYPGFTTLSMGMSGDYKMAVTEGSNLVRIGSLLFGKREYL